MITGCNLVDDNIQPAEGVYFRFNEERGGGGRRDIL